MKMWPGRGGQMGGPRWPNGRKGDRRLLWPNVWKIFFRSGQILQFTHDLFQFYKAFATKNFVVWENVSQRWNPCFLGVRSPNQLPKASWLGNLTTLFAPMKHLLKRGIRKHSNILVKLFTTFHILFTCIQFVNWSFAWNHDNLHEIFVNFAWT